MLQTLIDTPQPSPSPRDQTSASVPNSPCALCRARKLTCCDGLFDGSPDRGAVKSRTRATAARQNICRAGEPNEGVLVICEGWAVRFIQLPNGKRQILSVVLPGELVSPATILEKQSAFSVQAVTDVRYRYFSFAEVRTGIVDNPALFDVWMRLTAAEHRHADKRLVDLGQRTAQERIAALIVHMMLRCEERGELRNDEFAFPMSQQQVADFTGLTPVHACRVLSTLRRRAICDVGRGTAKIIDRGELERIGSFK